METKVDFSSDYMEGAYPDILAKLMETNMEQKAFLEERAGFGFWEQLDEEHTLIRFATSWATREENVKRLIEIVKEL